MTGFSDVSDGDAADDHESSDRLEAMARPDLSRGVLAPAAGFITRHCRLLLTDLLVRVPEMRALHSCGLSGALRQRRPQRRDPERRQRPQTRR